jgi:hypothetical protein
MSSPPENKVTTVVIEIEPGSVFVNVRAGARLPDGP